MVAIIRVANVPAIISATIVVSTIVPAVVGAAIIRVAIGAAIIGVGVSTIIGVGVSSIIRVTNVPAIIIGVIFVGATIVGAIIISTDIIVRRGLTTAASTYGTRRLLTTYITWRSVRFRLFIIYYIIYQVNVIRNSYSLHNYLTFIVKQVSSA